MSDEHAFVVLAFGDSPFLAGCLASLGSQNLPSRVVVVTSTPSLFIEAAARGHSCELIINPLHAGIASDWNFALTATQARFVTLAHQDDTYGPDFTAQTLAAFAGGAGALCFTGYDEIDDDGAPKHSKISRVKHLLERVVLGRHRAVQGVRLRAFLSFGRSTASFF